MSRTPENIGVPMVPLPQAPLPARPGEVGSERAGLLLVLGAAVAWSLGGAIARFIETPDSWAIVFWRSLWAAAFLLAFMLWRDGPRRTLDLFLDMGLPGLAVALCFATASTSFVVALAHTTVANILLIQASVPLVAALIAWLILRENVSRSTWIAIWAVILGVAVMVSETFSGRVSPLGDGLAVLITVAFATATVITRRYSHLRMTPAVCLGTLIATCVSGVLAEGLTVTPNDFAWLFAFGALNLGLGMALFVTGARMTPATLAALVATLETMLGPIWVWLVHGEIPTLMTLAGGSIILVALIGHIVWQWLAERRPATAGAR